MKKETKVMREIAKAKQKLIAKAKKRDYMKISGRKKPGHYLTSLMFLHMEIVKKDLYLIKYNSLKFGV